MFAAHVAMLVLIGITPLLLFLDNWLVTGIVVFYAAVCLGVVAISIRPGAARHWINTMWWATALAALPIIWLVIQLLPLPIGGLSRSIWQSAGAALNVSLWPHATIDPGLTLLSLCRYLGLIAVGLVAGAIAIERQEAERVFLALGCATAIMALISLVGSPMVSGLIHDSTVNAIWAGATEAAALGVVIIAGIALMIVERHLTHRPQQNLFSQFYLPLGLSFAGLLICCLGILASSSEPALFAASCGLVTVAIVYFVRRIGLGWRAATIMAAVGIFAAAVIVSARGHPAAADLSVRYAAGVSTERISVTNRIISEVGMSGSGAGTFAAIHRLYGTQDQSSDLAPTFASKLAIELGRPALWVIVAMAVALIVMMARGGFMRGRDFFYSITGAGVLVAALILAFCSVGQTSIAVSIVLAATVGLALLQGTSRTI